MEAVKVEIETPDGWVDVGHPVPRERPGSMSSTTAEGRRIYVFGWLGDDGPALWESKPGVDIEVADLRLVTSAQFDKIDVITADRFIALQLDRLDGRQFLVRFCLVEHDEA